MDPAYLNKLKMIEMEIVNLETKITDLQIELDRIDSMIGKEKELALEKSHLIGCRNTLKHTLNYLRGDVKNASSNNDKSTFSNTSENSQPPPDTNH